MRNQFTALCYTKPLYVAIDNSVWVYTISQNVFDTQIIECTFPDTLVNFSVLCTQVYSSGALVFLPSGGLLPSSGRRQGGVVWFPSVSSSCHVEHDAQHRW